jgi:hypothetical protein
MKRLLGQVLLVSTCGVLATALTPACADNDQSIYVRQVMAPPLNRQNGQCSYTPDPTQPFWPRGQLDVGIRATYDPVLLVGGQLNARGDTNTTRAEPNRAHLNGAVVPVTDANGAQISEFTSLGAGTLDPQSNNIPSWGLFAAPIIDAQTSAKLKAGLTAGGPAKLVVANIKVFGKTLGGVDLESGEFQFPIEVCVGCLVDFSTGNDPATKEVDCTLPLNAAGGGTITQLPCAAGQDERTPCQLCAATNDLCKAPP